MDDATRHRRLLEAAEELAEIGSWDWDPDSDELLWSPNTYRILDLDQRTTTPTPDLLLEVTHPDDRERVVRELADIRAGVTRQSFDYRILRRDGAVRYLRSVIATTEDGRRRRVWGYVQDLTSKWLAEREIALHLAAEEVLSTWHDSEGGPVRLLSEFGAALGCELAVLWAPTAEGPAPRANWIEPTAADGPGPPPAIGEPGAAVTEAFETGRLALHTPHASVDPETSTRDVSEASTLAFPALTAEEILAVLEFQTRQRVDPTARMKRSLAGIGHELGVFFARHRDALRDPVLTPRESEVLKRAADGAAGPAIAEALGISRATVKTHFENIYAKLGVPDRAAAVAVALRDGWFE